MKQNPSKIGKVMHEFKMGTLHGGINPKGPKKAPVVKNRKQAVAIALSEAGMSKPKKMNPVERGVRRALGMK